MGFAKTSFFSNEVDRVPAIEASLAVVKLGFEDAPDEIRSKKLASALLLHIIFFLRHFRENINFLENIVPKLQKD